MKSITLTLMALVASATIQAQVMVNGKDVNQSATTMEVWAMTKPFTNAECLYADFGQDKFRPSFYDHKTQAISDKNGRKFEKGEWVKLLNYLESEGWEKTAERPANIGQVQGRVVTFSKKKA